MKNMYDVHQIDDIKSALKNTPIPARKFTKLEAVIELIPALKKLQGKGHDAMSLAHLLEQQGIKIGSKSLIQLLNNSKAKNSDRSGRKVSAHSA